MITFQKDITISEYLAKYFSSSPYRLRLQILVNNIRIIKNSINYYRYNNLGFDNLSSFVEYNGNKYVLHLVFVNNEDFIKITNFEENNKPKLLIEERKIECTKGELTDLVCYFADHIQDERFNANFKYIYRIIVEDNNESEYKLSNAINDRLYGFEYDIIKSEFFINEIIVKNTNYNISSYKRANDNDILVKPKIPKSLIEAKGKYVYRIFNVGQANCSALLKFDDDRSDYKVVAIFDIGCEKAKRKNNDLIKMLNKVDSDTTIIISHFDTDHFNFHGAIDINKTYRWLFPEHEPEQQRANKFYQSLLGVASKKSSTGTIYSYKPSTTLAPFLSVYQNVDGKKDKYQSTPINAESIICVLKSDTTKILIPGDALYNDFPDDLPKEKYTHIVVPHHCCEYVSKTSIADEYHSIISQYISRNTKGYVMCGKNSHGHANKAHLEWFDEYHLFYGNKIYDQNGKFIIYLENNEKFVDIEMN